MPQLFLPGFPEGASRINSTVSVLSKEGRVTYFVGADSFYWHEAVDHGAQRFAITALLVNGHLRPCEVERSFLGIPHRTLMNWTRKYEQEGPSSFFRPPRGRGGTVMNAERCTAAGRLLDAGYNIAATARRLGVGESTLAKAVRSGRVVQLAPSTASTDADPEQVREDARAAEGMGTACTRAAERMGAAIGLLAPAQTYFEHCRDVAFGGLLAGLPALCANGLLSGLDRHLRLPHGFYSAMHILSLLGYMALARIRRPEGLRHVPPGELGKVVGLDRVPEVRTLREKIAELADNGTPTQWMEELSAQWMEEDPEQAGYLYVDGHVRVYHGSSARLPKRFVSRQKLCLKGTTDYWVNDALGRPFFVVSKAVTEGLAATLLAEIVPQLLDQVPLQPTQAELDADPLLHRFVVIFDREGFSYELFSKLWDQRIGAITYRKRVKDQWPQTEFAEVQAPVPGGGATPMRLACRDIVLSKSIQAVEVRRLTDSGHQTSIVSTAKHLQPTLIAGQMFSRWCQENFFAYMMQHYDIDGLVQYGSEPVTGTTLTVNPLWRTLDQTVKARTRTLRRLEATLGASTLENDGVAVQQHAELLEDIQQSKADIAELRDKRRQTPRKVTIDSLPEDERPRQLLPLAKTLTDTVKMIAYRAETALVGLLRSHLVKEEDARALIRELFVSAADIVPDKTTETLTVRIHRMACPAHDKAIAALLVQLTQTEFRHPDSNLRMIYELA